MVLSTYEKQKIVFYHSEGLTPSQILSALKVEDVFTTRQTIARFIARFQKTGTIARKEGSGRPSKITDRVRELVERRMREDDETTATQLHTLLSSCGISHLPIHNPPMPLKAWMDFQGVQILPTNYTPKLNEAFSMGI